MLDLEFKLKPSKQYVIFIAVLLLASVGIVLFLPVAIWLKIIGIMLITSYLGHVLWHFGLLRSQSSILSFRRHSDGGWRAYTQKRGYEGELSGDSTVTGALSVLRFRVSKRYWPKTCIIFRDSLGPDVYRQLLVVLKATSLSKK